jgi:hypothetical protein
MSDAGYLVDTIANVVLTCADSDVSAISGERHGCAEVILSHVTRKIFAKLHPGGGVGGGIPLVNTDVSIPIAIAVFFDATEGKSGAIVR